MRYERVLRFVSTSIALVFCATSSSAQWSSNPANNLAVGAASNEQLAPRIAAAPDGSTWLGWFDQRTGFNEIYVQHLDAQGNATLPPNGLLVSSQPQTNLQALDWELVADAQGNAVLCFMNAVFDIRAFKVGPTGTFLWGVNGIALTLNNGDYEPGPQCAALSDGSFVFVWPRFPSGGGGSIRVQRLDAAGVPQYVSGGFPITGLPSESPGVPDVVDAGSGEYIVTWIRDMGSASSPRHVRALKFDSAGGTPWGSVAVNVFDAVPLPDGFKPDVQADGAGGVAIAWHAPQGGDYDCRVQKLDANGVEVFPHNGVRLGNAANTLEVFPSVAPLASGDVIVAFGRRNSTQTQWGINVQRVSASGALSWGADGLTLEAVDTKIESFQRALPFGDGALVFYFDQPARVLGWRLDGSGNSVWGASATVVSSNANAKTDLQVALAPTGDARLAWHDARTDVGDIYAQTVDVDGTLGNGSVCMWSNYCVTAPNSVGPGALISASGSTSVALDSLVLSAGGCPSTKSCMFFYAPNATAGSPFNNGFLCMSGGVHRLHPQSTGAFGTPNVALDIANPPSPSGQITAGSTWRFQLWYRDPTQPPAGANLSNALSVRFCQ
ncbi:MAG: hypothetical protein K8S98_07710 [Planctomycetes bacterium]|nr:hypothetical protein [Planctomycetota bacterium]